MKETPGIVTATSPVSDPATPVAVSVSVPVPWLSEMPVSASAPFAIATVVTPADCWKLKSPLSVWPATESVTPFATTRTNGETPVVSSSNETLAVSAKRGTLFTPTCAVSEPLMPAAPIVRSPAPWSSVMKPPRESVRLCATRCVATPPAGVVERSTAMSPVSARPSTFSVMPVPESLKDGAAVSNATVNVPLSETLGSVTCTVPAIVPDALVLVIVTSPEPFVSCRNGAPPSPIESCTFDAVMCRPDAVRWIARSPESVCPRTPSWTPVAVTCVNAVVPDARSPAPVNLTATVDEPPAIASVSSKSCVKPL